MSRPAAHGGGGGPSRARRGPTRQSDFNESGALPLPQGSGVFRECPPSVLIEAVEAKGFGGGGMAAPAFGDVQAAGVFEGRDDGGADGGQVGGPAAVRRDGGRMSGAGCR